MLHTYGRQQFDAEQVQAEAEQGHNGYQIVSDGVRYAVEHVAVACLIPGRCIECIKCVEPSIRRHNDVFFCYIK